MLPNKRKPVADQATGFQSLEMLPSKFDTSEDSPNRLQLQAARLCNRFAMSWPLACAVASLAYGEAR